MNHSLYALCWVGSNTKYNTKSFQRAHCDSGAHYDMAYFTLFTGLLAVVIGGIYLKTNALQYPAINDYPGDFFRIRASQEYISNARQLIADGRKKFQGKPFSILVPYGVKVILPPSLTDWVRANRDLDHQQLVRDEYGASYPGFQAQLVLHHPNRFVINIIQAKLAKNDQTLPVLDVHIKAALSDLWCNDKEWRLLDWENATSGLISRAAAAVFVGPELASDAAWQKCSRSYVSDFFAAVSELHTWHPWLRPFVHWFLPHASACRAGVRQARRIINKVVSERRQKAKAAEAAGDNPLEHNDVLAWTMNARGCAALFEPGDVQLALAMAAFFTTAEVLRQVLLDVAQSPELIDALRHEIETALESHGLTAAALFRMELLDSVMKESQRLMPALGMCPPVSTNYRPVPLNITRQDS